MQYVFGDYTLDVQRGELRTDEGVVRLDRQVFTVLAYLVALIVSLSSRPDSPTLRAVTVPTVSPSTPYVSTP